MSAQAELEKEIRQAGIQRARRMMERNEQEGRADSNPYASALYRRFLLPLVEAIKEAKAGSGKVGRRAAHVALLQPLDDALAAFVAVNHSITTLMQEATVPASSLASDIGTTLHREYALSVFATNKPELYWEVTHDLDRRHSKNTRHRFNALAGAARNAGVSFPEWGQPDRIQLGLWLLEALRALDMVEFDTVKEMGLGRVKSKLHVRLTSSAMAMVANIKDMVELTTPYHMPFVEQPKDWTGFAEGGYHTTEMRAQLPFCVQIHRAHRPVLEMYQNDPKLTDTIRKAINKLQSTPWQINRRMLDAVKEIAKHMDTDEILMQAEVPKPPKPDWLEDQTKDQMTAEQVQEFAEWKRLVAAWHTEIKLRGTKWGRFYTARRIADKFKDYDRIYFLYQADFRGRLYAISTGLSPQGSDLSKALLRFADGKPLDTEDARRWFRINIANKFGVDKVSFDEQLAWVADNERFIIAMGTDPLSNRGWLEADCPLQFLACCMEYADWHASGFSETWLSHLPVGLDGSCNGLQHFSAMLRDSVGGRATNLLPDTKPRDIYRAVAEVTQLTLTEENIALLGARDLGLREKWLKHGINRSIVKRSVMTLPYGSTRFSSADYIVADYLRHGLAVEFIRDEYQAAANFLSFRVWSSIGKVVVAAREAMDWLQRSAGQLIREGHRQIAWDTPSGFRVVQVYDTFDHVHIRSALKHNPKEQTRIRVGIITDKPAAARHKNGMSPNFVHSMDASHLALCTIACDEAGIESLAMIHDDYGTHARDAQKLFHLIRETFVDMYEKHDPLVEFASHYPTLKAPPKRGDLDLREVLKSPYFFR